MRFISYLVWLVLIIIGIVFAVLNSHHFPLNYFFGTRSVYFPLLLVLLLVVGAVLAWLALLPVFFRYKTTIRKLRHNIKMLQQEVTDLRQAPVKGDH